MKKKRKPVKVRLIVSQQTVKIDKNRMIDYLDDCNPAIRHLAYINLMIA